jgi:putative transcriptional regulator
MERTEDLETSLAPGILVAAPNMGDPNFAGSVVLMAEHGQEGSLGFIVNRPAPIAVSDVLAQVDQSLLRDAAARGRSSAPVLLGGPVQPERLWVMCHRSDVPRALAEEEKGEIIQLGKELAVGGSRELLEAVVRAPDGSPFYLVLGYSGWGPLQVENEVGAGAWLPSALQRDLVFEVPFADRWAEAVKRLGLTPGGFAMGGGGAKA